MSLAEKVKPGHSHPGQSPAGVDQMGLHEGGRMRAALQEIERTAEFVVRKEFPASLLDPLRGKGPDHAEVHQKQQQAAETYYPPPAKRRPKDTVKQTIDGVAPTAEDQTVDQCRCEIPPQVGSSQPVKTLPKNRFDSTH